MEYSLRLITDQYGTTPLLVMLMMCFIIIIWALFSLTGLATKLIEYAEKADKWYMQAGTKYQYLKTEHEAQMSVTKLKLPCKFCGAIRLFKFPKGTNVSNLVCACETCAEKTYNAPCDLCGTPFIFFHPSGKNNGSLNICTPCTSNPEGWKQDWIDKPHQQSIN